MSALAPGPWVCYSIQEPRPTTRVWLGRGPSAAAQATKHCEQLRAMCWIRGPGRPRCAGWFPSLQPQTCEHISVMATAGRGEPLSPRAGLSAKQSFCSGQEARRPTSLPRKPESCALRSEQVRAEATSCGPGHWHPLPDRKPGIRPTPCGTLCLWEPVLLPGVEGWVVVLFMDVSCDTIGTKSFPRVGVLRRQRG